MTATVTCSRCREEIVPEDPGRCPNCKVFVKGNEAALTHGARRLLEGAGSPLDEARRVELRDTVLADLGGELECSAVLVELVESFAEAVLIRETAWAYMAAVGPMKRGGGTRPVVDLYWQANRRVERLAKRIGTERRSAEVTLSDYVEGRVS